MLRTIVILAIALNLYAHKIEVQLNNTDIGVKYQYSLQQEANNYYIEASTLYQDDNITTNMITFGVDSLMINDYGYRFGLDVSVVNNESISVPFGLKVIYDWDELSMTEISGKYATKVLSEDKDNPYNSYSFTQYFKILEGGYLFARYTDDTMLIGASVGF